MKLSVPNCPECGERAEGILNRVKCLSEFKHLDNGEVEERGYTKIYWDSQEDVLGVGGKPYLVCRNGHQWSSKVEDDA